MQMTLIYIHGQYGSPDEAEHYRPLFPGREHWFHTPEQMAFLDEWIQRTSLAASYLNRSSRETE